MIIVAVTLYDDIFHPPITIQRLVVVVGNRDLLDELPEVHDLDVRIVGSSTASCIQDKDRVGGRYELGIDEGVLGEYVVPFCDQKSALA